MERIGTARMREMHMSALLLTHSAAGYAFCMKCLQTEHRRIFHPCLVSKYVSKRATLESVQSNAQNLKVLRRLGLINRVIQTVGAPANLVSVRRIRHAM